MTPAPASEALFFQHARHESGAAALDARGVSVAYGTNTVLERIAFSVAPGERLAVVGPNGAGKTTLFRTLAGLIEPEAGSVLAFGQPPRRHACIAYLVQRSEVDLSFPVTVADVVMMGLIRRIGLLRYASSADRALVDECLRRVGMAALARRQIRELSGGQQQRMFIARALAQRAEILLMDEPFTGVDATTRQDLLDLIDDLARAGVGVLVATHDLDLAATRFPRVMLLNRRLVAIGPPDEVFTSNHVMETFGRHAHTLRTRDGVWFVPDSCCAPVAEAPRDA